MAGPSGKGARPEAARPSAADGGRHCPWPPVLGERRRTKTAAAMAYDPGHYDDAPAGRSSSVAWRPGCRDGCGQARIEVIVLHRHGRECFRRFEGWRSGFEIVRVSGESASRSDWLNVLKLQSNQPHAPCRRRRFYLAFRGWGPLWPAAVNPEPAICPSSVRWSVGPIIANPSRSPSGRIGPGNWGQAPKDRRHDGRPGNDPAAL